MIETQEPTTTEPEKVEMRTAARRMTATLKARHKLPGGFVLQKEVEVEYEMRSGKKIIVGPKNVRPQVLLGTAIP